MTATKDIRLAIEAWADSVVPELNTFESPPEDLAAAFPLAVASNVRQKLVEREGQLPGAMQQYQQLGLTVWSMELFILVDPDPATADDALDAIVDQLAQALGRQRTLGGRVQIASPFYETDKPGEMTHPSGVVGRVATFRFIVGEATEVQ